MIVVKIHGGLGNQMFQYAFARALSIKMNTKLKQDISFYNSFDNRNYKLPVFNIKENEIASKGELSHFFISGTGIYDRLKFKIKRHLFNYEVFEEKSLVFDATVYNVSRNAHVAGYWQSERYFKTIENEIRKEFEFKLPPSPPNAQMMDKIINSDSVSIHVRRGDYVSDKKINQVHGVCDLDYYNKAIARIQAKCSDPNYFIFSDDMDWVKENLKIDGVCNYIDFNVVNDYEDLRLMSMCKHNITANSSFSWWGAWLNSNTDKLVIAPQKWFNDERKDTADLIPESWVRI